MAVNVNRARRPLNAAQLEDLDVGDAVIDADMDISVRRADGLWEGYEMGPIPTAKLLKYGPIKRWPWPVPAGRLGSKAGAR